MGSTRILKTVQPDFHYTVQFVVDLTGRDFFYDDASFEVRNPAWQRRPAISIFQKKKGVITSCWNMLDQTGFAQTLPLCSGFFWNWKNWVCCEIRTMYPGRSCDGPHFTLVGATFFAKHVAPVSNSVPLTNWTLLEMLRREQDTLSSLFKVWFETLECWAEKCVSEPSPVFLACNLHRFLFLDANHTILNSWNKLGK